MLGVSCPEQTTCMHFSFFHLLTASRYRRRCTVVLYRQSCFHGRLQYLRFSLFLLISQKKPLYNAEEVKHPVTVVAGLAVSG